MWHARRRAGLRWSMAKQTSIAFGVTSKRSCDSISPIRVLTLQASGQGTVESLKPNVVSLAKALIDKMG